MKSLNGKELMRGDCVLTAVGDTVIAGNIHELYDRNQTVRVAGYPIPVKADNVVLAKDAWDGFAAVLIAKRKSDAEAAEKAKVEAEAKADTDKTTADSEPAKQNSPPVGAPNV